jgi:lysophospholipid acyltransferase (LPLAT)-like uncharacterized protein
MAGPDLQIAARGRPLGGPLRSWLAFRAVPALAAWLVRLLTNTLRVRHQDHERVEDLVSRGERIVLSFYHRRLILMPQAYPFRRRGSAGERRGVAILSSDSKDGERSAATWRWFGIHAVRGTAGDRGAQALVRMIQAVRQDWDLGITVDGPRGPCQEVKPGVLAVSRKTGAWIVPVCVGYARAWKLRTWDALLVPKPFTEVVVRYGTPFQVPPEGPEAAYRDRLQADLDGLEAWAAELLHG